MGRSLSDGFSQVMATTAQICSAVYVAGAPDRGASASRSQTECLSSACRHRLRQYRTVFGPDAKLSCALAHTHALDREYNDAGTQCQLLGRRMGSYQLFQHRAVVGQNNHWIGGQ
jgi:hypothetical protein